MILPILTVEGNAELLHKVSSPIDKFDKRIRSLIENMIETAKSVNAAGLAAPQIGKLQRIIVIKAGEGMTEIINPYIMSKGEAVASDVEECLSMPGVKVVVERSLRVSVAGADKYGKFKTIHLSGFEARAMQHEIDHLDGILITDRGVIQGLTTL